MLAFYLAIKNISEDISKYFGFQSSFNTTGHSPNHLCFQLLSMIYFKE